NPSSSAPAKPRASRASAPGTGKKTTGSPAKKRGLSEAPAGGFEIQGREAAFRAQMEADRSAVEGAPTVWTPHRPERTWNKFDGGRKFRLASDYDPAGDQPQAIADLVGGVQDGEMDQVLLGVTGSG